MEEVYLIIAGIVVLCIFLCLTICWLLSVVGIFNTVDVGAGTPPISEVTVAYKFAKGPYKNAGEIFGEVSRIAPDYKCIGLYYDDPQVVAKDKLRYAVGAILAEGKVKVEQDVLDKMESEGMKIIHLPAVANCVKTSFPYINVLSIPIAVWKVYPQLANYVKEHRLCAYPFIEIYESDVINFMAPLSKQDEFFVPEAKESIPDEYKSDDDSLIDISRGSPSLYGSDISDSSRSRSRSAFSSASRILYENFSDEDDSDADDKVEDDAENVQDGEITSSVEVRASKACTNLLEESELAANRTEKDGEEAVKEEVDASLQDSGICSGRTSVVPADTSAEAQKLTEAEANDSSSSFEEINMEEEMNRSTKAN